MTPLIILKKFSIIKTQSDAHKPRMKIDLYMEHAYIHIVVDD